MINVGCYIRDVNVILKRYMWWYCNVGESSNVWCMYFLCMCARGGIDMYTYEIFMQLPARWQFDSEKCILKWQLHLWLCENQLEVQTHSYTCCIMVGDHDCDFIKKKTWNGHLVVSWVNRKCHLQWEHFCRKQFCLNSFIILRRNMYYFEKTEG